jgi:hypothetical protein
LNDPNASFMDKILRLKQARDAMAASGNQTPPPQPVTIPRVQAEAENPSFFSKNPGLGKGVDATIATLALLANMRASNRNRASGYHGHQTSMLDLASLPTVTGKLKSEADKKAAESLKIQQANVGAAESEAKINESAMNQWANRRNAEMGQVMPSIARATMRDPRVLQTPALQQKLDALHANGAYQAADKNTQNQMELRVISAQPRTPEDTATAYAKAFARFQGRIDAMKKNGITPGGRDQGEVDVADGAKYMADLIHNDFVDPEKAADMAIDYLKNKQTLRTATGGKPTMQTSPLASPAPPVAGAVPPGQRPLSPAGADQSAPTLAPSNHMKVKADIGGLPPDLQGKLQIYARQVSLHPERKAELRADLMRTYQVDPDTYLEPGP